MTINRILFLGELFMITLLWLKSRSEAMAGKTYLLGAWFKWTSTLCRWSRQPLHTLCLNLVFLRFSLIRFWLVLQQSRIEYLNKRGLWQGDPISLLLFVLIMEYLRKTLKSLSMLPNFNFYPKSEKLKIISIFIC